MDGAATSSSQDGHIRAQVVQNAAPMPAGILVEQGAFRRLEQVHKAAAIAAHPLRTHLQVRKHLRPQARQPLHDLLQACHPLLIGHPQVAQTDLVGLDHSPLRRPHTGMQARIDRHGEIFREANALPTADREQLCQRHA